MDILDGGGFWSVTNAAGVPPAPTPEAPWGGGGREFISDIHIEGFEQRLQQERDDEEVILAFL